MNLPRFLRWARWLLIGLYLALIVAVMLAWRDPQWRPYLEPQALARMGRDLLDMPMGPVLVLAGYVLALLRRAEAAGYTAIALTLDAAIQVPSLQALHAGFRLPPHVMAVNLHGNAQAPDAASQGGGHSRIFQGVMRQAPTWADVDWLLTQTALPVWIKGVLHPDDAVALKARGVAGLVVSNHGGRGLDGAPASLHMLPKVRQAVGAGMPLMFDGGIRSGADVFKALALGADAVLVGRLQLYALAVAGALGVAHMLQLLRDELEICMAQAGCATLADIHGDCVLPLTTAFQSRITPDADHH